MDHLACHHWSNVQTKLTNFRSSGQKIIQKQPKMTVTTSTSTCENLDYLNTFHLLKTEGVNQREGATQKIMKECLEFIKILTLI